jgi:hypothetical protein
MGLWIRVVLEQFDRGHNSHFDSNVHSNCANNSNYSDYSDYSNTAAARRQWKRYPDKSRHLRVAGESYLRRVFRHAEPVSSRQ